MSEGKIQAGSNGLCLSHEHFISVVFATKMVKVGNQNDVYMYELCYVSHWSTISVTVASQAKI